MDDGPRTMKEDSLPSSVVSGPLSVIQQKRPSVCWTARRVGMRVSYASRAAAQVRQGISIIDMDMIGRGRSRVFIAGSLSADGRLVNGIMFCFPRITQIGADFLSA